jgi:hypothetical protein
MPRNTFLEGETDQRYSWRREKSVDMLVFLFTDIEGSSKLWEEHTEAMTPIIARHDEILREKGDPP